MLGKNIVQIYFTLKLCHLITVYDVAFDWTDGIEIWQKIIHDSWLSGLRASSCKQHFWVIKLALSWHSSDGSSECQLSAADTVIRQGCNRFGHGQWLTSCVGPLIESSRARNDNWCWNSSHFTADSLQMRANGWVGISWTSSTEVISALCWQTVLFLQVKLKQHPLCAFGVH